MEITRFTSLSSRSLPTPRPSSRFSSLNPEEDCSLIPTPRTQPIETRRVRRSSSQEKCLSPSLRWDSCKVEFFKKLVGWPLEGKEDTQRILEAILESYLNTLDTTNAQQLPSAHCKEMVMHALLLKNPLLWKTCLDLKLHQKLDEKDFCSTLELAIDVDNDSFLQCILTEASPFSSHNAHLYKGALQYALQSLKPQCLSVLLHTLRLNDSILVPNLEELTLPSVLQTLIQQRQSNPAPYTDHFQSCIQAVLRCFKDHTALPSLPLTDHASIDGTFSYVQLLSNSALKTADKKILLALFLEYDLLTAELCQQNPALKHLFDVLQDQKRFKKTKKAFP